MAVTIWSSDYQNAALCELASGGLASVAVRKSTSPAAVWFRRSNDGTAWNAPVLIGTMATGKMAHIHERNDGTLIATNGIDAMWQSVDGGRTWGAY